jgi:membrane protein
MVAGAELNAALAETPEEAENRIGQADDRVRAAVARELERMQEKGIG